MLRRDARVKVLYICKDEMLTLRRCTYVKRDAPAKALYLR